MSRRLIPDGDASLVLIQSIQYSFLICSELDVGKLRTPTQQRQLQQRNITTRLHSLPWAVTHFKHV